MASVGRPKMLMRKPVGPSARIAKRRRIGAVSAQMGRVGPGLKRMLARRSWTRSKAITLARPLVNYGSQAMPNLFKTKFVYQWNSGLTIGVGPSPSQNNFRGNSIYDPDSTGVGTTVNWHSELGAIYNKYKVTGSRITVVVVGYTVSNPLGIVVWPSASTSTLTTSEMRHIDNATRCVINSKDETKTLVMYAYTPVFWGLKNCNETNFTSTWSSNPANQWYWHVGFSGDTQDDKVLVTVMIEYYTTCFDKLFTSPSAI